MARELGFIEFVAEYIKFNYNLDVSTEPIEGNFMLPKNAKQLRKLRTLCTSNVLDCFSRFGPATLGVVVAPWTWGMIEEVAKSINTPDIKTLVDNYSLKYDDAAPVGVFADDYQILQRLFCDGEKLELGDKTNPAAVDPDVFRDRAADYFLSLVSQVVQIKLRELADSKVLGDGFVA